MFSNLLSKSLSLSLLILVGFAGDVMAAERSSRQVQVSRTYNYNWQSEILVKHPNAAHFNWTPMTVTRARVKSGGSGASSLPRYRNTKPKVVAWNSLRRPAANSAAASTAASVSGRVGSASETYGTSAALSYDNVSAQLREAVHPSPGVVENHKVEGRVLRYGNSY